MRARNAQWRIDQRHDRAVGDGGDVLVEVGGVSGRSSVPDQMRPGRFESFSGPCTHNTKRTKIKLSV